MMKRIFLFIFFISAVLFSSEWDKIRYFYTNIQSTNKTYTEKTYKGVTYNIYTVMRDKYGKRICTQNKQAKEYALFLGCSLIFGDGVENKDTLPQLFQDILPKYQAYNYGYCGEGPNDALYRLQTKNIVQEVDQAQGMCFFFYPVGWHEVRVRLHSNYLSWGNKPYYEDKNGRLVYKGTLKEVQWFIYYIMQAYNWLPIPDKYRQPFPKYPTEKDYILISDILCGLRDDYKRKFNSDKFYIVIHPFSGGQYEAVIKRLQSKGLSVIALDDLIYVSKDISKYIIAPWDGHPNARMNKLIARALADKMRELGY